MYAGKYDMGAWSIGFDCGRGLGCWETYRCIALRTKLLPTLLMLVLYSNSFLGVVSGQHKRFLGGFVLVFPHDGSYPYEPFSRADCALATTFRLYQRQGGAIWIGPSRVMIEEDIYIYICWRTYEVCDVFVH